jgi:hypothetical protein
MVANKPYKDFALSHAFHMFLAFAERASPSPIALSAMMINEALLIQPGVNLRRLERAFLKITNRHDSLRTSLVQIDGRWKVRVYDEHTLGLIVKDFGEVSDETFERTVLDYGDVNFTQHSPILFEAMLMRFGSRGDVLFMKVSHIIADGYSMVVLTEELLSILLMPGYLLQKTIGYEEYLKNYMALPPTVQKNNSDYWRAHLLPALPAPNIGRKAKNLSPDIDLQMAKIQNVCTIELDRKEARIFSEANKVSAWTPFGACLAAFTKSVCDIADIDAIYCDVTIASRDKKLSNYVGNCIYGALVRSSLEPHGDLRKTAISITERIREHAQHLPDLSAKPLLGLHQEIVAAGGHPRQFKCGIATAEGRQQTSIFANAFEQTIGDKKKIAGYTLERIATARSPGFFGELRWTLKYTGDQTSINMQYDPVAFTESEISKLLGETKNNLMEIARG